MKALLVYLLQVIACSGLLYGYYHFVLRNKKFHRYNRYYLILVIIISILIPFLNIPVYFSTNPEQSSVLLQTLTAFSSPAGTPIIQSNIHDPANLISFFNLQNISFIFYVLIGVVVFTRFILSLYRIGKLISRYDVEKIDRIYFVNTAEPGTPFSFFRWLFWNRKIEMQSENGQQIFKHELFHIQQKHTWDIVFLETLTVVFWINPFFHLIKKEIKTIHEFLADQFAVKENDKWNYAELLLMQVLQSPNTRLTNPFFHNQVKRRISMITSSKKPEYQYLRKVMVLPIAAIVMVLFAFSYKAIEPPGIPEKNGDTKSLNDHARINTVILSDTVRPGKDRVPVTMTLPAPKPFSKAIPPPDLLNTWQDANIYGVWIDGKRINNNGLKKYRSSDFSHYYISKLAKTAVNYGRHYYQVDLMTNRYYDHYIKSRDTNKQFTFTNVVDRDTLPASLKKFKDHLIIVDGKEKDITALESFPVTDIKTIHIIKDNSGIVKYGQKAKNGVIEINTKNQDITITGLPPGDTIKPGAKKVQVIDIKENKPDNVIFEKVEIEPSYPGGETAWRKFLEKNLNPSVPSDRHAPAGAYTVFVQFIVDKEGNISDLRPLTKFGYGMEEEVLRIIKLSGKWEPGIQNGHKVNAYKKQRIDFGVLKETTQSGVNKKPSEFPPIHLADLKKITPASLAKIPTDARITGFAFSIDNDKGEIIETYNYGDEFSEKTKSLIQTATAGRLITMEGIIIVKEGTIKHIPSLVYIVTD